eukprot:CAMPEP_0204339728 /NCGR_PEP_ID=MMETSP0469-20131031/22025_1 /ASSEMBLY_ACC=CAM_ASM_000384 /TAXON_ID=2969 /ORGANISM="Oxyrrhis marina" /LENGTH=128 /DNA_ID=CAMNT_0051324115 /DNA_START=56 /DNA_END=440 /DNA_ORIENTATION=+
MDRCLRNLLRGESLAAAAEASGPGDHSGAVFELLAGVRAQAAADFLKMDEVEFPPPKDININMMPFVPSKPESLPEEYHGYLPLVTECDLEHDEESRVCYLTIHESVLDTGPQRRPGLHVEAPGVLVA